MISKRVALFAKCIFFASFQGCGASSESVSTPQQFFENSVRREATDEERNLVVRTPGCTAFFVENTAGKTYLISARHCFKLAITNWCQNGGTIMDNDGIQGQCSRIIAADTIRDIALFEVDMAYVPETQNTLKLAAYQPTVGTRLKMVGYPGDKYRNGALTVTENCWVLYRSIKSPHTQMRDRSSLHNCSTYGGNSGGPMIRVGSRDAIGLPFTYLPNDYRYYNATNLNTAASLAQMADFVAAHRGTLEQAGVVISEN